MGKIQHGKNSTNFNDEWVKSFASADEFVKANDGKGALSFVTDKNKREAMLKEHWAQVTGINTAAKPATKPKQEGGAV